MSSKLGYRKLIVNNVNGEPMAVVKLAYGLDKAQIEYVQSYLELYFANEATAATQMQYLLSAGNLYAKLTNTAKEQQ